MSVVEALKAARAAGVELAVDGDHLALKATSAPPAAVLEALSRHKAEIVMLLRPGRDGWSAEDWRARFDERAGFLEHDAGLSRLEAEVQAFKQCIVEWLNANPSFSLAGRCAWCGKPETPSATVLPFGAGEHHAWLHAECWALWYQRRREEAVLALRGMGITMIDGVSSLSSAAEQMRRYRERRRRARKSTRPTTRANAAKRLGLPFDEPSAKPPAEAPQPQPQPSTSNGIPEDRRGFVGYVDGRFVHYCPECGEWGAHGIGVFLRRGQLGVWYCAEHKPKT